MHPSSMAKTPKRGYTSDLAQQTRRSHNDYLTQSLGTSYPKPSKGNNDAEKYQRIHSIPSPHVQYSHGPPNRSQKSQSSISPFSRDYTRKPPKPNALQSSAQHRKRKAAHQSGRTAEGRNTRPRLENNGPFMDEKYIRAKFAIPLKEQYPAAPETLFGPGAVSVLHGVGGNLLSLRHTHTPTQRGFRCKVIGNLPNNQGVTAQGDGRSKSDATKAAYLHLLSQLHESGILKEIFTSDDVVLNQQELQDERDAKLDVYNYGARFLLVPEISSKTLSPAIQRRSKQRNRRRQEVTVELKEQGLRATASAPEYRVAEINACFRLKQEIEKYHAKHGDESITIKDSETINSGNAKGFVDFWKLNNKGFSIETKVTLANVSNAGNMLNSAQTFLNEDPLGPAVIMPTKKAAEELSLLVAAVALSKRNPELQSKFRNALSISGELLAPLRPVDLTLDSRSLSVMKDTLREIRQAGLPEKVQDLKPDEPDEAAPRVRERKRLSASGAAKRSEQLLFRQKHFQTNQKVKELRESKANLPMSQNRAEVLKHIGDHTYSVIVGTTGSGKTTQVPQILLEDAISNNEGARCDIICTQPRRIAAISVARRVAAERNEELQDTVGYQVRYDAKLPIPGGSITYCTTGILLQQLQRNPDQILDGISHIIIDEVHERDIFIDFLLTIVKKAIQTRRIDGKSMPKVVLMSATIDSDLFSKYFEEVGPDGEILRCPTLTIPGRTFPVVEKHLDAILEEIKEAHGPRLIEKMKQDQNTRDFLLAEENLKAPARSVDGGQAEAEEVTIDWKRERMVTAEGVVMDEQDDALVPIPLIATAVAHIAKTSEAGAILVFHPGYDEIKGVLDTLKDESPLGINFKDEAKFKISILHSTIPAAEQQQVFQPVPDGCRKIILSTNIAETSVTIPDVQYVVDSGKLREKRYDQVRRITKLQCTWISKSNAKQRAGRAGRVQNGNYYALYSSKRAHSLRAIGLPEMLRSDLQEVCLDIKAQAFKLPIREFLSEVLEPPAPSAVEASVLGLQALQALTEDEKLTSLGRLLASLPVHPSLGKMIVLGVVFRCLDPMIILGACFNERALFVTPPDKRAEARAKSALFLQGSKSDHIAALNAFRQMRSIRNTKGVGALTKFGVENFIHIGAFNNIYQTSQQIETVLAEAGLIPLSSSHIGKERSQGQSAEFGHSSLNENSSSSNLIKALVLAGSYPNVAVCKGMTFRSPDQQTAMIHPSSLNYFRPRPSRMAAVDSNAPAFGSIFSYGALSKTQEGRYLLKDTTLCTPLMALLFGGHVQSRDNLVEVDGWLPFYIKASSAGRSQFDSGFRGFLDSRKTLLEFRDALDRVLVGAFQDLGLLKAAATKRSSNGTTPGHGSHVRDRAALIHGDSRTYLADDDVRTLLANGLVEVLNREAAV